MHRLLSVSEGHLDTGLRWPCLSRREQHCCLSRLVIQLSSMPLPHSLEQSCWSSPSVKQNSPQVDLHGDQWNQSGKQVVRTPALWEAVVQRGCFIICRGTVPPQPPEAATSFSNFRHEVGRVSLPSFLPFFTFLCIGVSCFPLRHPSTSLLPSP